MIKTKKGASGHVEVIVSFVIFASFIVFLLIFLNPVERFSKNTSYLEITEVKILDYVSTNLTSTSLKLNSAFDPPLGGCLYVGLVLSEKVLVEDEDGNSVDADNANGRIYFNYFGSKFYRIYSSAEFTERNLPDLGSCSSIAEENYTLGVTNRYEKVSKFKLASFDLEYNNYDLLKENLGLKNDFNFEVRNSSGPLFEGKISKPELIDIMAKDIPIQILDENNNLNPAIMNIQVWG